MAHDTSLTTSLIVNMKNFELKQFSGAEDLARAAAQDWLDFLGQSTGRQTVAFSGGRIAKTFFSEVAGRVAMAPHCLDQVEFFWADERCVPPDSTESNYWLARENLFSAAGIASERIHRLKGELPPAQAVAEANATIQKIAPGNNTGLPVLDLIFLGLGENAHIASLMPGIPAAKAEAQVAYVTIENSPKPPPNRLSLTYAAIAAAKNVWMLASGQGKEDALRQSLQPNAKTPFGRVLQSRARTIIYSDIAPV